MYVYETEVLECAQKYGIKVDGNMPLQQVACDTLDKILYEDKGKEDRPPEHIRQRLTAELMRDICPIYYTNNILYYRTEQCWVQICTTSMRSYEEAFDRCFREFYRFCGKHMSHDQSYVNDVSSLFRKSCVPTNINPQYTLYFTDYIIQLDIEHNKLKKIPREQNDKSIICTGGFDFPLHGNSDITELSRILKVDYKFDSTDMDNFYDGSACCLFGNLLSKAFIITGPPGTGKSTLVEDFLGNVVPPSQFVNKEFEEIFNMNQDNFAMSSFGTGKTMLSLDEHDDDGNPKWGKISSAKIQRLVTNRRLNINRKYESERVEYNLITIFGSCNGIHTAFNTEPIRDRLIIFDFEHNKKYRNTEFEYTKMAKKLLSFKENYVRFLVKRAESILLNDCKATAGNDTNLHNTEQYFELNQPDKTKNIIQELFEESTDGTTMSSEKIIDIIRRHATDKLNYTLYNAERDFNNTNIGRKLKELRFEKKRTMRGNEYYLKERTILPEIAQQQNVISYNTINRKFFNIAKYAGNPNFEIILSLENGGEILEYIENHPNDSYGNILQKYPIPQDRHHNLEQFLELIKQDG